MQIFYFCLYINYIYIIHPLILAFLLDFACSKLLLCYPDSDFLSLLPSTFINWNFSRRKVAPSFHLFIYLIIYLHQMDS